MNQRILLVDIAPELAIVGDPPAAFVGASYTHTFTAVEGTAPFVWSVVDSVLPAGWTLNASTGVLAHAAAIVAGPPVAFTVQCRDAFLIESTKDCVVVIAAPLEAISKGGKG